MKKFIAVLLWSASIFSVSVLADSYERITEIESIVDTLYLTGDSPDNFIHFRSFRQADFNGSASAITIAPIASNFDQIVEAAKECIFMKEGIDRPHLSADLQQAISKAFATRLINYIIARRPLYPSAIFIDHQELLSGYAPIKSPCSFSVKIGSDVIQMQGKADNEPYDDGYLDGTRE